MRRLARRTLNALTVLSVLLSVGTAALWVRSCFASVDWAGHRYDPGSGRYHDLGVRVVDGVVEAWAVREWPRDAEEAARYSSGLVGWGIYRPLPSLLTGRSASAGRLGFALKSSPIETAHYPGGRAWWRAVVFPAWAAVAATAALPVARVVVGLSRGRRRRLRAGRCQRCGYDLRATPARCPECGEAVQPPTTPTE